MESIKDKFDEINESNPYWSTYICFCETIKEKELSIMEISSNFKKLVDKSDYDSCDFKGIVETLKNLSKKPNKINTLKNENAEFEGLNLGLDKLAA